MVTTLIWLYSEDQNVIYHDLHIGYSGMMASHSFNVTGMIQLHVHVIAQMPYTGADFNFIASTQIITSLNSKKEDLTSPTFLSFISVDK